MDSNILFFFYLQYYHPQRAHRRQQNLRIFVGNLMTAVNHLQCRRWLRILQIHRPHHHYNSNNNNYNKPQEDWLAWIFHCLRLVFKLTWMFWIFLSWCSQFNYSIMLQSTVISITFLINLPWRLVQMRNAIENTNSLLKIFMLGKVNIICIHFLSPSYCCITWTFPIWIFLYHLLAWHFYVLFFHLLLVMDSY